MTVNVSPPLVITADGYPPDVTSWRSVNALPGITTQQIRPNLYRIRSVGFDAFEAEQNRPDFCWAACIQMVLQYQRIPVDQYDVAKRVKGTLGKRQDLSATLGEMTTALAGIAVDVAGRPAVLEVQPFTFTSNEMVIDVGTNWPVLVGLADKGSPLGHVCVLAGMDVSYGPRGEAIFHKVTLYDPSPTDGGRTELSAREFKKQVQFAMRTRVSHR